MLFPINKAFTTEEFKGALMVSYEKKVKVEMSRGTLLVTRHGHFSYSCVYVRAIHPRAITAALSSPTVQLCCFALKKVLPSTAC